MTKNSTRFLLTVFALAMITTGCEHMQSEQADVQSDTAGMAPEVAAPITGPDRRAHGSQHDTLEACLARIPSDATTSQRMLAETTCHNNAKGREDFDQIPGHKRDP